MAMIQSIIALAMVYALLSVVASAVKELLEAVAQKRKRDIRGAIEDLLSVGAAAAATAGPAPAGPPANGPAPATAQAPAPTPPTDLARTFLASPVMQVINGKGGKSNPLGRLFDWAGHWTGWLFSRANHRDWPSYIDAKTFAMAIEPLLATDAFKNTRLAQAVAEMRGEFKSTAECIQTLYEQRMDRLIGSFKRNAQWWLLCIGLALASVTDADTLYMARVLSSDAATREALVKLSESMTTPEKVQALCAPTQSTAGQGTAVQGSTTVGSLLACVQEQAPAVLGWTDKRWEQVFPKQGGWWCNKAFWWALLGYLLTAVAISLGAPFWFDLISKVANLRATLKPKP